MAEELQNYILVFLTYLWPLDDRKWGVQRVDNSFAFHCLVGFDTGILQKGILGKKKKKEESEFLGLRSRYIYSISMSWRTELSLLFFFGGGGGGDRMKLWFQRAGPSQQVSANGGGPQFSS